MKIITFFILVAIAFTISGCGNNDPCNGTEIVAPKNDVDGYIELLRSNSYTQGDLPAFTAQDIPALLEYRNERQVITNFPHNPISSFYGPECALGIYVLWTIESIRAVAIDSEYLIMHFPSQNPILALRDAEGIGHVNDLVSHTSAANAYYIWWYNHSCRSFDEFKHIDPLANTPYEWR